VFEVILYRPQIPPNTGNVIRLCANTGCRLHLIEPLGFTLHDADLRRAGLDYHELAPVSVHPDFDSCRRSLSRAPIYAIETGAGRPYTQAAFRPGDALLFGAETAGLPAAILTGLPQTHVLSIPMRAGNRSLNLSNAVALVVYEAWRQNGFAHSGAKG
jgi:tRNA (cytidine/uridine-2'-O-)-methyltransferase